MTWNWNSVDNGPHRDLVGTKHISSALFIERFFSFFADKFSIIGDLNNVWEMLFI